MQYLYATSFYYSVMQLMIESAFLVYYLRLSPNRVFQLTIGVSFGLNVGLFMFNILIIVFQCMPVSAALTVLGCLRAECMDPDFLLIPPATIVSGRTWRLPAER
jgi:hypothetical protein